MHIFIMASIIDGKRVKLNRRIFLSSILIVLTVLFLVAIRPVVASADSWITKAPSPIGGEGAAVVNGEIYLMGSGVKYNLNTSRWNISSSNYMYDPANDTWVARTPM